MAESTVESIEIEAPPERVFEVASAVESYPEWVQGVREVEVLERDADGRPKRARFVVDAMIKELRYELTYDYDPPNRIHWVADPNDDIRELEGAYEFTDEGDGVTQVVYALRVDPAFRVPGFLRKQAERTIINAALRGLKKRVEQLTEA